MTDRELMQMALDYLDAPSSKVWAAGTQYKIIQALRARLAQPEPEPHGYLWFTRHMEQRFTHRKPKEDERIGDVKPLYTAPPQHEWQGLTDEDIEDACWTEVDQRLRSFARAIEAMLKEKNNA